MVATIWGLDIFLDLTCTIQDKFAPKAHLLDVSMSNTNRDILTIGRSTECQLERAHWEQVNITLGEAFLFPCNLQIVTFHFRCGFQMVIVILNTHIDRD